MQIYRIYPQQTHKQHSCVCLYIYMYVLLGSFVTGFEQPTTESLHSLHPRGERERDREREKDRMEGSKEAAFPSAKNRPTDHDTLTHTHKHTVRGRQKERKKEHFLSFLLSSFFASLCSVDDGRRIRVFLSFFRSWMERLFWFFFLSLSLSFFPWQREREREREKEERAWVYFALLLPA